MTTLICGTCRRFETTPDIPYTAASIFSAALRHGWSVRNDTTYCRACSKGVPARSAPTVVEAETR